MCNNEQLKIIMDNLHESLSALTDAKTMLEKNKKTKVYLDKYNKFEDKCHAELNFDESNKLYETIALYEQSLGITAFLIGFQKGVQSVMAIQDKDFVSNMVNLLL